MAALILSLTWALLLPPFQAPDENSHFGYGQTLAEQGRLPGDPARPAHSTEQTLAAELSNADQTAAQLTTDPAWDPAAREAFRERLDSLTPAARSDGGGPNPAASNPPLYYGIAALAYLAASGGDLFDRLTAMRIMSALWWPVTVAAVWLLIGEVFPRNRLLQIAGAGLVGLAPMPVFISASVSPDAMLYALWTLTLWQGARALRRGLTPRSAGALALTVGVACLVKTTSYALLPALVFVVALGLWRGRPLRARALAGITAASVAGIAVTLGAWYVIAGAADRPAAAQLAEVTQPQATALNIREIGSYVWQFYLPRFPFQTDYFSTMELPLYEVWLKGGWGLFGWLEVRFAEPVYLVLAAVTALVAAGALLTLARTWRRIDWGVAVFVLLVAGALLGGLHWTEYHLMETGAGLFNQGRYLFPLLGIAGVVAAAAVLSLPPRWRPSAAAAAIAAMLGYHWFSLGLMLERFYA